MPFFTGPVYDEATEGDLPFGDPFGPIIGGNTTVRGNISDGGDIDVIFIDVVGLGNNDSDHPRAVAPGPLAFTLTLNNVDDFQIIFTKDDTAEVIYQKFFSDVGNGTTVFTGSVDIPADEKFAIDVQLSAFGTSLTPTNYELVLGAAAPLTHADLGTLHDGESINRSDAIPAGQDEFTYDFRIEGPLTLYNLRLTGPDVQGILEADAVNKSPTLGPGPDRHLFADSGFGSDPQIIEDPLMPGLYHYTVTRNGVGSNAAPFTLVSDPLQHDEAGNNRDWTTTIPVVQSSASIDSPTHAMVTAVDNVVQASGSNDSPIHGTVTTVDNKDVYKFTLTQDSSVLVSLALQGVSITQDGVPPIHYEISRSDGSLVLESHIDAVSNFIDTSFTTPLIDPSNTTPPEPGDYYNSDPNNIPLDPGDYFITIYKSALTSSPENYKLWVNAWPDDAANRPTVSDFGAEGPASAVIGDLTNTIFNHHDFLGLADRNDFFVFYVTQRMLVTFNLTNASPDVAINLNLGGLPYHNGEIPDDPLTLPTPDPLVSDIGPFNDIRDTGGPRSFSAILDPGIYNLRAYTETSFADPNGTANYNTDTLVYPKNAGAFYDLQIVTHDAGAGALDGTPGDDKLFGSNGPDVFNGLAGADAIVGGPGLDVAIFLGLLSAYTISRLGATTKVTGPDGTDTLTQVERLQFDDATVNLGRAHNDFNGDGKSDVLFSNQGAVFASNYEWQLDNRSLLSQGAIDLYDKAFTVQAVGDYDGDGKADVLFQNPATGGVWEWRLDGRTILSQGAVDVGDPSFHLLGTGDLNGDGKDDLLFRNNAGFVYEWQMDGLHNTPLAVGPLDPKWHVQGTGDFNGDGKDDILLHYKNAGNAADPANGAFVVWQMNGNTIANTLGIERPDPSWQTLGIGDFNGDGIDDLAIRNVSNSGDNGAVWVYLLAGTVTNHGDGSKTLDILAQGAVGIADPATWHLQQIGDMDGDGRDDILYRNDAGYFYSWDMNGTTIASEGLLQGAAQWADPSFTVVKPHWDLV